MRGHGGADADGQAILGLVGDQQEIGHVHRSAERAGGGKGGDDGGRGGFAEDLDGRHGGAGAVLFAGRRPDVTSERKFLSARRQCDWKEKIARIEFEDIPTWP